MFFIEVCTNSSLVVRDRPASERILLNIIHGLLSVHTAKEAIVVERYISQGLNQVLGVYECFPRYSSLLITKVEGNVGAVHTVTHIRFANEFNDVLTIFWLCPAAGFDFLAFEHVSECEFSFFLTDGVFIACVLPELLTLSGRSVLFGRVGSEAVIGDCVFVVNGLTYFTFPCSELLISDFHEDFAEHVLALATVYAPERISVNVAVNQFGVPGLANMFARVYGSTAQDARLRGDDVETASLKGLKAATIEVVTEKIGGAFEGAYGKSLTSEALNAVRKKFGNVMNRLERSGVLRWVLDTVGEGGEEALADILNTTVDHMVGWDDGSMTAIEDILSQKDDILYDTFLGSLVGSLGASTNLISNRANARANAQNSAPAQTAQEAQNVQRDIPAAPKTGNVRTADSGALNAALETIGAVTRAGGSAESAMKLLSPKQIDAYNNYLAEKNSTKEAANKPAESENANAADDELAALNKALKGYDEQTRNDIIEEYRKAVEGEAPISFDAKVNREATRAMREAEAREKGIEVFKPAYDEDALDIAERRVTARKEARYQDKRKPVATPENSEYDDTRFKFDYEAARKKAEKAYDLELKRWYAEHPNESEPDPDSWLSDRSAYISEYVRRLSRIEFAEHKKANELISKAQFRDRNLGKTGETHQETRQDDYRRDDEAYKDNVDEDWDTNSRRTDISGNKVDVYGTRSISRGTFRSDAEAPPVTAAERRYAKLIGKERADSIEKREAARAAVTENATERMERMAAENKLLRKVVEAKTEEERASAQEEYKKFKDNEAANLATKNGGEDDVHRIRYDEVRGRPGLESGDRGNIENVRRDADSRELGRLSEVVRHAGPAEREQRLEEAGYKTIPEREYSSEEVKANKVIRNLVGDDANVVILAGEGRDSGLAHTESDGRRTIFLVRKPNPRYRMEDVAAHEAAHIRMPEGIKSNAHQYAKYLLLNNGFT